MHIRILRLTSAVLLVTLLTCVALPAQAIESHGVGARPANPKANNPRTASIFIYEPRPGEVIHDAVKVINNTDKTKKIAVTAVDGLVSSDGAFGCAQEADPKLEAGSWIKLSAASVTLKPNTTQTVPFAIHVSKKAEPGEHNACIAVQDGSVKQNAGNGIILSFRSALRVAITIPGAAVSKLNFTQLDVDLSDSKVIISPTIQNDGNVSVNVDLGVELSDILNLPAGKNGGEYPVLSKASGRYNFEIDRPFWGGWYKVKASANYVQLSGGDKKELAGREHFMFIPPQPQALLIEIALCATVIAAIIGGIWYWLYRRRRDLYTVGYTVKPGEDIQEIALRYSIRWKTLAAINRIKAPYNLETGQQIKVPRNKQAG